MGVRIWFNYVMMPRLNMTIEERLIIRYNKENLRTLLITREIITHEKIT